VTSQTDLDQGGTSRQYRRQYLGPSLGWIESPAEAASILAITAAGTYSVKESTTLVTVNVNGAVVLNLPKAHTPTKQTGQLGLFVQNPITIVDIGGFAAAQPIVINPNGAETIMGLTTISITIPYGGFTLKPSDGLNGWSSISP
jgi:hypothetical protein